MAHEVLDQDWSEYDNRKKKYADANFFACTELWERKYLIQKIRIVYHQYSESSILAAINGCCREVGAPHPRKDFIECVMKKLRS